jgi:hypothetical protein
VLAGIARALWGVIRELWAIQAAPHVTHGVIDIKPIGELQAIRETLEDLDKASS